jgi:DNA-binding PadR family transcriptional regulator
MDYRDRTMLHGNAETLVLAILVDRPCHGYEIRKELATRSNEHFHFAFGRLYPLLRTMEHRDLITTTLAKSPLGRECRQHAITIKGRAELRVRKEKWHQFAVAMNRVLSRS